MLKPTLQRVLDAYGEGYGAVAPAIDPSGFKNLTGLTPSPAFVALMQPKAPDSAIAASGLRGGYED